MKNLRTQSSPMPLKLYYNGLLMAEINLDDNNEMVVDPDVMFEHWFNDEWLVDNIKEMAYFFVRDGRQPNDKSYRFG